MFHDMFAYVCRPICLYKAFDLLVMCPSHRVQFLAGRGIWTKGGDLLDVWGDQNRKQEGNAHGTGQQAPEKETGVMADANHASGAGAGSRGCPIRTDAGDGAAGGSSSNPRCSKRKREQEEDQGMAGEDPGINMACVP